MEIVSLTILICLMSGQIIAAPEDMPPQEDSANKSSTPPDQLVDGLFELASQPENPGKSEDTQLVEKHIGRRCLHYSKQEFGPIPWRRKWIMAFWCRSSPGGYQPLQYLTFATNSETESTYFIYNVSYDSSFWDIHRGSSAGGANVFVYPYNKAKTKSLSLLARARLTGD